jgi:hypothetical protein
MVQGKNIENALNEMLYADEVNKYDSAVKKINEVWYEHNLSEEGNKLEDTVYCNSRDLHSIGGWNPDGGSTSTKLQFKNYSLNNDLACANETDQFAVSNNKAKLTYPIGLIMLEEESNLKNQSIITETEEWSWYWSISPEGIDGSTTRVNLISGNNTAGLVSSNGVRPVVTLASFNTISSGTGSESDPWVID